MGASLTDAGAVSGAGLGADGAGVSDAEVGAWLSALLGAEPSDELLTAFKGDQQLMGLVKQLAQTQRTLDQVEEAKQVLQQPAPQPRLTPPGGHFWDSYPNPTYAADKQKYDDAQTLLNRYYQGGNPLGTELSAYKTLASQRTSLVSRAVSRLGQVQTAQGKTTTSATNPPDLKEIPTGNPGETQQVQYDPATGTWKPAIGADGQPVPPKQSTTAPRVAKGTQSWDLKELNGVWYQVPTVARADGTFEIDTASGRLPQRVQGLPGTPEKLEVLDGVPYQRDGQGNLVPVPGYVKPPLTRFDAQGKGYYSTDNGRTWQASQGLPGTPQTITVDGTVYPLDENGLPIAGRGVSLPRGMQPQTIDGYLVQVDPTTGEVKRTDLYTPEQRDRFNEVQGLDLQTARTRLTQAQAQMEQAQRLTDPTAEYQRQVTLTQQQATKYRDQLNDKILQGQLSVEDASRQFDDWWGQNVEAKLSPYQTMAEASYRKEQNEYQRAQAAEQARVDAINRERERVGFQAQEKARQDLMTLAPSGRSPEFLNQLAQNVSRIGQPLPGGVTQHHGGMQFSPESLSLDAVRRSQPSITEVGQQASARALAGISPAAAQSVGLPPPQVPSLPQMQQFMNRSPFTIPNPALPIPGMEALDMGNAANATRLGLPLAPGTAMTVYQGGRREPWAIPAA